MELSHVRYWVILANHPAGFWPAPCIFDGSLYRRFAAPPTFRVQELDCTPADRGHRKQPHARLRGASRSHEMDIEKYTDRSKGFIQSAQSLALREGHQQFTAEHLL